MPKVVSGKDFDNFVMTGQHQTIDDKKPVSQAPTAEKPAEVKELIAKSEAASAEEMQPKEEDTGLEAEDSDLAERAQKRISKKHREMKQAEALANKLKAELEDTESFSKQQYQRAQAAEEEAARLKAELAKLQTAPKAEPTGLVAPDENNPKYRNDKGEFQLKVYEKDRDDYLKAQIREELKAEQAQAEWQKQVKTFEERVAEARKKYSDWNETVGAQNVEVQPYIQRFMVESEQGAEIGYYFAKHPEEFQRISALHPIRGSAELGKLEGKLAEANKPKVEAKVETKEKPKAPEPITPLTGSGNTGIVTDPSKMSPKQLLEYTRAQEAAKRARRFGR